MDELQSRVMFRCTSLTDNNLLNQVKCKPEWSNSKAREPLIEKLTTNHKIGRLTKVLGDVRSSTSEVKFREKKSHSRHTIKIACMRRPE